MILIVHLTTVFNTNILIEVLYSRYHVTNLKDILIEVEQITTSKKVALVVTSSYNQRHIGDVNCPSDDTIQT